MTGPQHTLRQDCEVLLRQIDLRLAELKSARPVPETDYAEVDAAERVAAALRLLVTETVRASAADRARVRAAVHFFAAQGRTRTTSWRYGPAARRNDRRPARTLGDDVRVVNEILRDLGGV